MVTNNWVYIFLVISSYWIVSISLVFVNKHLLTGSFSSLDAPLFVTCFQCGFTVVFCYCASSLASLAPNLIRFPDLLPSVSILLKILPLSIIFVCMVGFNNICLKYLNVSFYYLARCLTTVFNVILTKILLNKSTSVSAIVCCGVILLGYIAGVLIEGSFGSVSAFGLIFGLASSLACSLNSIYTSKLLPLVDNSVWRLTFYNNVNAVLLLAVASWLFEGGQLREASFLSNPHFWLMLLVSGFLGFAIGYVSTLQIQATTPLTHNVSGTAKAAAQTVIGVVAFQETKSVLWWLANATVLFGSAAYCQVRRTESNQEKSIPLLAPSKSLVK